MGCGGSKEVPPTPTKPSPASPATEIRGLPEPEASAPAGALAAAPAPAPAEADAPPPAPQHAADPGVAAAAAHAVTEAVGLGEAERGLLEWGDEWYRTSRTIAAVKDQALYESMPETRGELDGETEKAFQLVFENRKNERLGKHRSPTRFGFLHLFWPAAQTNHTTNRRSQSESGRCSFHRRHGNKLLARVD